jgi:hypothetical protein
MKVRIEGDPIVAQLSKSLQRMKAKVAKKMRGAMADAAKEILDRGREDIRSAGNFGSRWTEGLTIDSDLADENKISITLREAVPYWSVFQYGKTIKGRPLLWIPMGPNEGSGISAKDFPGRLFRVDRLSGGAPLLLSVGKPAQVQYHGQTSVYIPKKFHLLETCREVASELGALYRKNVGD